MTEETTLEQILSARENRSVRQRWLLREFNSTLLCFTMNIAGPIKLTPAISRAFSFGCRQVGEAFPQEAFLHQEQEILSTGCTAYFVLSLPALEVKKICTSIETASPLGRLFDLDVLSADGHKLDRTELGAAERSCLVCGAPGRGCASRRVHTVEELQAATQKILRNHFAPLDADQIARHAERSLLDEVLTTPKPGLVDCRNNGSHQDMNLDTFRVSAKALRPYFASCISLGQATASQKREDTFSGLRLAGLQAEDAMYAATGGVNTHKGIIFSLGLLCGALGRLWSVDAPIPPVPQILLEAKLLAAPAVAQDFSRITADSSCTTSGETLYRLHGLAGIRGEAAAGFPSVAECALPAYRHARSAGLSQNDAGTVTLLHLIASVHDTNLYRRGGIDGYRFAAESASALLAKDPFPTTEEIRTLDDAFIQRNLSPGGCADLLALTYFLFSLEGGSLQ